MKNALKILVIDDDRISRLILTKSLTRHEATVLCAENGEIGVEIYKAHADFDVVISDCEMPVMTGCEALRAIQNFNTSRNIHASLFVVTGKDENEVNTLFKDIAICHYFQKPIDHTTFFKTILSHLPE